MTTLQLRPTNIETHEPEVTRTVRTPSVPIIRKIVAVDAYYNTKELDVL